MKAPKCVNCGEPMTSSYTREGLQYWICGSVKAKSINRFQAAIYCTQFKRLPEQLKNVKLFKEQLISKLIKKPLPKEDYKKIEKEIKKLEQADVNDVLFALKNEEKNLKKQIEITVRESIDLSNQVEDAYGFYTFAFILQKFADKVGLEIDLPKDSKEFMKAVVEQVVVKA
jgi:hypothetical protein